MSDATDADDLDEVFDYETLSRTFNQGLVDKLRSHGVGQSFLEFWVPDADPLKGLVSMIDSAGMAGRKRVRIGLTQRLYEEITQAGDLENSLGLPIETSLKTEQDDGYIILNVSGIADPSTRQVAVASIEPSVRQARTGPVERSTADIVRPWQGEELIQAYNPIAEELVSDLRHEDDLPEEIAGCTDIVSRATSGAILKARIQQIDHTVVLLVHSAATNILERAVLDKLCAYATGKPLVEAGDHAGLQAIDWFLETARERMKDAAALIPGIVLPSNQPEVFQTAIAMIRDVRSQYEAMTGSARQANKFAVAPGPEWLGLSDEERLTAATTSTQAYLRGTNLAPDSIQILRVEKNRTTYPVRVAIGFDDQAMSSDEKPDVMRMLERWMRRELEPTLELIAERVTDESPLRRLSDVAPKAAKTKKQKEAHS